MLNPTITIETVPAGSMRYDTAGDYFVENGCLRIQVSDTVPEAERFLVALHEMVEAELCRRRGITFEAIDAFDFAFKGEGEPGDDPQAPYRKEHRFSMLIEHLVAHELGLDDYGTVA